jgi:hypothetical protein
VTPYVIPLKAKETMTVNFHDDLGLELSEGIVVCNSTTDATKTLGSADCLFSVGYT